MKRKLSSEASLSLHMLVCGTELACSAAAGVLRTVSDYSYEDEQRRKHNDPSDVLLTLHSAAAWLTLTQMLL